VALCVLAHDVFYVTYIPYEFTLVNMTAALSTGVATMSSLGASNWLLLLPDEEQLKKTQYSNKVPSTYCLHSIFINATYFLAKQTSKTKQSTK